LICVRIDDDNVVDTSILTLNSGKSCAHKGRTASGDDDGRNGCSLLIADVNAIIARN
jgi:hypothetical protein